MTKGEGAAVGGGGGAVSAAGRPADEWMAESGSEVVLKGS